MPVHAVSILAVTAGVLTAVLIVSNNARTEAARIVVETEAGQSDGSRAWNWRLRHPPPPGGW